jgi:hypothetical protein
MAFYLYKKSDGTKVVIHHMIDVIEALKTGNFTKKDPKGPQAATEKVEAAPPAPETLTVVLPVDLEGVEEVPKPPEDPEKPQEVRPEDKIVFKEAKTIGMPKKNK